MNAVSSILVIHTYDDFSGSMTNSVFQALNILVV